MTSAMTVAAITPRTTVMRRRKATTMKMRTRRGDRETLKHASRLDRSAQDLRPRSWNGRDRARRERAHWAFGSSVWLDFGTRKESVVYMQAWEECKTVHFEARSPHSTDAGVLHVTQPCRGHLSSESFVDSRLVSFTSWLLPYINLDPHLLFSSATTQNNIQHLLTEHSTTLFRLDKDSTSRPIYVFPPLHCCEPYLRYHSTPLSSVSMAPHSKTAKAQPRSILKSSSRPTKPFKFFALPRELRDIVYDHSLSPEETWGPRTHGLEVRVTSAPVTKLLLVSRQFGREYRESVGRNAELTCVDVGRDVSAGRSSSNWEAIPKTLRSIGTAHFAFWVLCRYKRRQHEEEKCVARANLKAHLDEIEPLLSQVLSVGNSTVTLYFEFHREDPKWCVRALQKEHRRLTSLPGLSRVIFANADAEWMQFGPETADVFMEWDKKTDTMRRVEKSEGKGRVEAIEVPAKPYEGSIYSDDGVSDYSARGGLSDYSGRSHLSDYSGRSVFSDHSARSDLSTYSARSDLSTYSAGSRVSGYLGSAFSGSSRSRLSIASGGGLSDYSGGALSRSSTSRLSIPSDGGPYDYSGLAYTGSSRSRLSISSRSGRSDGGRSDGGRSDASGSGASSFHSRSKSVRSNDRSGDEGGSTGSEDREKRSGGNRTEKVQAWMAAQARTGLLRKKEKEGGRKSN